MTDVIEKRMTKQKTEWLPVIFANGEDDDGPGVAAYVSGRKVQFGDEIYAPEKDLLITGRKMVFDRKLEILNNPASGTGYFIIGDGWPEEGKIVVISAGLGCLTIEKCYIYLRGNFYK